MNYLNDYLSDRFDDVTQDSSQDVANAHVEGSILTDSELTANGIVKSDLHTYTWHFNGSYWTIIDTAKPKEIIKEIIKEVPVNKPKPKPQPKPPAKQYVTVVKWTSRNTPWNSTLWGIANHYGMSLSKLLSFPENAQYRSHPDLIYVGNRVRVK